MRIWKSIELGYFKGTEIYNHSINHKTQIEDYKNLDMFYGGTTLEVPKDELKIYVK